MYIVSIDRGDIILKQTVTRITWPSHSDIAGGVFANRFVDLFVSAADLWTATAIESTCVRASVLADGRLVSQHALTAREGSEDRLRLMVAALLRLDGFEGAQVSVPETLDEYEEQYAMVDADWLALERSPLSTSDGGCVFVDATLFDLAEEILSKAVIFGYEVDYQCALRPLRPSPDLVRAVRKSAAHLARSTSAPARLIRGQSALGRRLAESTYHLQEGVRVSPSGLDWLRDLVHQSESASVANGLASMDDDDAAAFGQNVHSDILLGDTETAESFESVNGFLDRSEASRRMRCEPLWSGRHGPGAPKPPSLPIAQLLARRPDNGGRVSDGPAQPISDPPFLFVSYAHANRRQIDPLIAVIGDRALLWIDDKLHAGEEWDAQLEERLLGCAGLLAFVTDDYVSSKYCRRELKFADALGKPIIAWSRTTRPLTGGLAFLFASLQFVSGDDTDAMANLLRSINERAPAALK